MKHNSKNFNNYIQQREIVKKYPLGHYSPPKYQPMQAPTLFMEDEAFPELENIAIVEDYRPEHHLNGNLMDVEEECRVEKE